MIGERLGFLHQQGSVRADAVAVPAAQQSAHRLARRLAQQIPKRDVNAADRVRDRPAPALPESVLVQLFTDALGFDRGFAEQQRFEQLQSAAYQMITGKHAAQSHQALIRVHRD